LAAVVGCLPAAAGFAVSATQALLNAKADLSAVDSDGQTPLHLAAVAGRAEGATVLDTMLGYLEELDSAGAGKAIVGQRDSAGRSALHAALRAGAMASTGAVRALLSAGADASSVDHEGTAPLHLAAAGCSGEIVSELCRAGASVSILDGYGRTPVEVAAACGRSDLVGTLPGLSAEACGVENGGGGGAGGGMRSGAGGGRTLPTHLYAHPACLLHAAAVGGQVDSLSAAEKCAYCPSPHLPPLFLPIPSPLYPHPHFYAQPACSLHAAAVRGQVYPLSAAGKCALALVLDLPIPRPCPPSFSLAPFLHRTCMPIPRVCFTQQLSEDKWIHLLPRKSAAPRPRPPIPRTLSSIFLPCTLYPHPHFYAHPVSASRCSSGRTSRYSYCRGEVRAGPRPRPSIPRTLSSILLPCPLSSTARVCPSSVSASRSSCRRTSTYA
jgi:hypothetical protein